MPGKRSEEEQAEVGAAEAGADAGLGGLTAEELQQGQEAALELEDMMALSAQALVQAEVQELYEQVRPLGKGRFGQVLLVTHRQKGTGARGRGWGPGGGGVGPVGSPSRPRAGWGVCEPEPGPASALPGCVFSGTPLPSLSLL